jgi:hypothetical protein
LSFYVPKLILEFASNKSISKDVTVEKEIDINFERLKISFYAYSTLKLEKSRNAETSKNPK